MEETEKHDTKQRALPNYFMLALGYIFIGFNNTKIGI